MTLKFLVRSHLAENPKRFTDTIDLPFFLTTADEVPGAFLFCFLGILTAKPRSNQTKTFLILGTCEVLEILLPALLVL